MSMRSGRIAVTPPHRGIQTYAPAVRPGTPVDPCSVEDLEVIPSGCSRLRISEFPWTQRTDKRR
jgi:hypothetical protein